MPLLALHLPKSHSKAIKHVPQIVTYVYAVRVKEWSAKENKFGGSTYDASIGAATVSKKACLWTK